MHACQNQYIYVLATDTEWTQPSPKQCVSVCVWGGCSWMKSKHIGLIGLTLTVGTKANLKQQDFEFLNVHNYHTKPCPPLLQLLWSFGIVVRLSSWQWQLHQRNPWWLFVFLSFKTTGRAVLLISSQLPLLFQIQITALRENCELIDIYIFSLLLFYFFFHVVIWFMKDEIS